MEMEARTTTTRQQKWPTKRSPIVEPKSKAINETSPKVIK
jgi:hypothetical protein